jgi:peptide chain release factor
MMILEKKQAQLLERMSELGIREDEIEESFTRSSGKGGQHVNKTSTAVVLTHLPTGIRVRCELERSQSVNRFRAREILLEKIEARQTEKKLARQAEAEKERRQKRKRPRGLKERILKAKSQQSEKKRLRKKPDWQG